MTALCECGHSAGSHSHLRFNCMATHDHSHATRCSCRKFTPAEVFKAASQLAAVVDGFLRAGEARGAYADLLRQRVDDLLNALDGAA